MRCVLYIWSNKAGNFPVVMNETRVHHKGPITSLAQLLDDSVQRSSYNCCRHRLDILDIYVITDSIYLKKIAHPITVTKQDQKCQKKKYIILSGVPQ